MELQIFFLVMKIFDIYSFINFRLYNTVLLNILTSLYIYQNVFIPYLEICTFLLPSTNIPSTLNPFSGKQQSILYLYEFCFHL